jgi:maltose-binding protein MalE
MFKAAGIDPDKPFETLDEVVAAGQKLTKADQDIWGLGLYLGPSRATFELFYSPIVWAFGGDCFDATAKKATLTSDASLKAAKWLYDCVKTWKITPPYAYDPTGTYDDAIDNNFIKGKTAQGMGYGSYWIGPVQQAGMYENCFPANKDCKVGKAGVMIQPGAAHAQFTNAWCMSIHKLSKVPDMAFKLLMTIMKPENLKGYPDAGLPGRLSAWAAPEYSSDFYQLWLKAAKGGRSMPATAYYAELGDAVAAALQDVLSKDADIQATLKKTEDDWNGKFGGQ